MKIKLTIAGKETELSMDEARALHSQLAELFAVKVNIVKERRDFYPTPVYPISPVIIDRRPSPFDPPYTDTCRARP